MSGYHFKIVYGPHMAPEELQQAADVISASYTSWQNNPKNTNPVKTDTSPAVYTRIMSNPTHEVILYYDAEELCGVFVHALSPDYDRYPLRKLSYVAAQPRQKGYEALKLIFARYAEFVKAQGEDVLIASDLDQLTLNSLLVQAGFREIVDRDETYFLLSQLLQRKIFSFQKVNSDFVIDQIIRVDGKAVRRDKKLYKLQTTPFDFYQLYREQQTKRVQRCIAPENLALLRRAFSSADGGIFFISSFEGTITNDDAASGGFYSPRAMIGNSVEKMLPEIIAPEKNIIYLLPGSQAELRALADKVKFRPGFYDFLFYCLKVLGSFYVMSAATPFQVRYPLERFLAPGLPLRYADLIEKIITPEVELLEGVQATLSDDLPRTAYRFSGPYVDLSQGSYTARKDLMVEDILKDKTASGSPIVCLCSDMRDRQIVETLYLESYLKSMPVLVFDFGSQVTAWVNKELSATLPGPNQHFSIINIRDFYQIPFMLHEAGLKIDDNQDFLS